MQAGLFCASSAQVCFFGSGCRCLSWLRPRPRLRLRRRRMSGQVQAQAAGSIPRIHEFSILILMRHSLCCCSYEVPLVLYSYCPSNPRRGSVCRNSFSVNRNTQIHRLGGNDRSSRLLPSYPIPSHLRPNPRKASSASTGTLATTDTPCSAHDSCLFRLLLA